MIDYAYKKSNQFLKLLIPENVFLQKFHLDKLLDKKY